MLSYYHSFEFFLYSIIIFLATEILSKELVLQLLENFNRIWNFFQWAFSINFFLLLLSLKHRERLLCVFFITSLTPRFNEFISQFWRSYNSLLRFLFIKGIIFSSNIFYFPGKEYVEDISDKLEENILHRHQFYQ